jgi:hypothetical protein
MSRQSLVAEGLPTRDTGTPPGGRAGMRPWALPARERVRVAVLSVTIGAAMALVSAAGARPAGAITVTNTAPPGTGGFQQVLNWIGWGVTVAGVAGLMAVGAKMVISHRRGDDGGEQVASLGKVCMGLIVAVAAGPIVNALDG